MLTSLRLLLLAVSLNPSFSAAHPIQMIAGFASLRKKEINYFGSEKEGQPHPLTA